MSKTYTLQSTGVYGGERTGWGDAKWGSYRPTGGTGTTNRWQGRTSSPPDTYYYVTNILFNSNDLNSLRSKTILSVTLKVTVTNGTIPSVGSETFPIGYKYNSSTGVGSGNVTSDAWARGNIDSTAMSSDTIGYVDSTSVSGTTVSISLGTSVPKYGYVLGPNYYASNNVLTLGSSASLVVVTNENDYSYTLAYNANGGSGEPGNQTGSNTGTSPSYTFTISNTSPSRTGYTFLGWSTSSSATAASYSPGGSITVTSSGTTTLYAVWKKNTWTVSYNANGGSGAPASQTKEYNTALTLSSTVPTRTGYTFARWNTSQAGTGTNYSPGDSYTANAAATLYAMWTINTWTVSYNANGGSGAPASQTKTYNQTLTLSSTVPTRTGYTFLGWSKSSTATSATYAAGGSYTDNAAATLYAVWKLNTYTVSYNAGGGSGAPASQVKTYGVSLTLTSATPTWAGHTFSAWNTAANGSGTSYSPGGSYTANASATLYAIWDTVTYTVAYNANGGSGAPASQTKTYGVSLTLSSTVPTRTGYVFVNWNTKSDGTGTSYGSGGTYTANAAATLYATWTKQTYAVSYNANGGTGAPAAQTKTYGDSLTLSSTVPSRAGYTFVKWNTNSSGTGTDYNPGGSYTANASVTLYAIWTQSEYTVTYNSNGIGTAPASQIKQYDVALTLAAAITAVGSTMTEWNTQADGNGTSYQPGDSYTANAAVTLYAIWTPQTYTVTFDADGGTVSPATKTVTWGEKYGTLPTPTLSEHTFYGWFDPDDVLITANSQVLISDNITLTAAWEPRSMLRVLGSDNQLHVGAVYVKGSDNAMHMAVLYAKGSDNAMHING